MTGLSTRVTQEQLEEHFSKEGKVSFVIGEPDIMLFPYTSNVSTTAVTNDYTTLQVANCFLVVEPRSRISRGFAFITMDTLEDANRCIKHLNQSVLEHRQITVERVS